MSEFKTIVRKPKNDTIPLTINGTITNVCKKWTINNCIIPNCPNYHPKTLLCFFFQKGTCKWGNKCFSLHPIELTPKEIIHIPILEKNPVKIDRLYNPVQPSKGCMIITIGEQKISVCERWVNACCLPRSQRDEMSCYGIHQKDHITKRHLKIPLCEYYLNGKCNKGIYCTYPHPIELLNYNQQNKIIGIKSTAASSNDIPQNKTHPKQYFGYTLCTAMCTKHMLYIYDNNNPPCTFPNCKFAHDTKKINTTKTVVVAAH